MMPPMETPSTNAEKTPRLSLIACSRNDNWQGNSLWRLQTALNYAALQVAKLGRLEDVEIIVTDWGSAAKLCEAVRLTADAARIVRFLNVPTELATEKQKDSPFAEVIALNAAARRSRGDYIGRIDQDILVGRRFLEWFFAAIESPDSPFPIGSTAMISNRRRIPYDFSVRCLPLPIIQRYLTLFHWLLPRMYRRPSEKYWEVYVGILLMHRNLWESAGGYDETFVYYGCMEFEFFLRLLQRFGGVDLTTLVGCSFYHLDHVRTWSVWEAQTRPLNPERTPEDPPAEFHPNGNDWGLAAYDIPLVGPPSDALLSDSEVKWRASMIAKLALGSVEGTIQPLFRIAAEKAARRIAALRGAMTVSRGTVAPLGRFVRRVERALRPQPRVPSRAPGEWSRERIAAAVNVTPRRPAEPPTVEERLASAQEAPIAAADAAAPQAPGPSLRGSPGLPPEKAAEISAALRDNRLILTDYPYYPHERPLAITAAGQRIAARFEREEARYAETLRGIARYVENLSRIPRTTAAPLAPFWDNPWFPPFDAASLYGLIAGGRPDRYIEVGSGISTRFAHQAIRDMGLRTRIISIDPHPHNSVDGLCDRVIPSRMEDLPASFWADLSASDMLFVDSSHRSFPASDVTVFFTEVMPGLPPGIVYGLHDVFLPNDYPEAWKERYYNEQYLLMAYLLGGAGQDTTLLPVRWAASNPSLYSILEPLWQRNHLFDGMQISGGCYWVQRGSGA